MSWLVKAKEAIADKEYEKSLEYLDHALRDNPNSYNAYIERSIVCQRTDKNLQGLEDSEKAIHCAFEAGNRDAIARAQLRKGISLLSLNRPQDALVSFAEAEKFGCTDKSLVMWKAKAELSLRNKEAFTQSGKTETSEATLSSGDQGVESHSREPSKIASALPKVVSNQSASQTPNLNSSPLTSQVKSRKPVVAFEKNWDQLANEMDSDGEEETQNQADPMEFFKQLYKDADPDTQRAMMKSYIESNGTALSTNWEDVGRRTFETNAPNGMETKKWT